MARAVENGIFVLIFALYITEFNCNDDKIARWFSSALTLKQLKTLPGQPLLQSAS